MEAKNVTVTPLKLSRSVSLGLLGGFIGALIMGGLGYLAPTPVSGTPFFVAPFARAGLGGYAAYAAGWVLQIFVGLLIGALYGAAAAWIRGLRAEKTGWGILWGIVAGIVTWLIYGLPALVLGAGLGRADLVAAVLGFGLVFGVILGVTYSAAASRMGRAAHG